jgi:hypothetical protein
MGIDEFGNIVGWAADLDDGGRAKAILWRPVPESTGALALGGLLLLFALRGRRRCAQHTPPEELCYGTSIHPSRPPPGQRRFWFTFARIVAISMEAFRNGNRILYRKNEPCESRKK